MTDKTSFNPADGSPETAIQMAVIISEHGTPAQKMSLRGLKPHGCYNRAPYQSTVTVQDGHYPGTINTDGTLPATPKFRVIENPMTKECQYTRSQKTNGDPRCEGCTWKSNNPDLEY